jgi:hypothetical protein
MFGRCDSLQTIFLIHEVIHDVPSMDPSYELKDSLVAFAGSSGQQVQDHVFRLWILSQSELVSQSVSPVNATEIYV